MVIFDCLRLTATVSGYTVLLMWLSGVLGWADFTLLYQVRL